jgi:hypothetical protein
MALPKSSAPALRIFIGSSWPIFDREKAFATE